MEEEGGGGGLSPKRNIYFQFFVLKAWNASYILFKYFLHKWMSLNIFCINEWIDISLTTTQLFGLLLPKYIRVEWRKADILYYIYIVYTKEEIENQLQFSEMHIWLLLWELAFNEKNNYTITIIGTWSPWKPTLLIWYDFWWVKKWVKSRCKRSSKAWNDEKEKWSRENERRKRKEGSKSKGFALGTRSQNYMAKVPTWFNTITVNNQLWSVTSYAHGTLFDQF